MRADARGKGEVKTRHALKSWPAVDAEAGAGLDHVAIERVELDVGYGLVAGEVEQEGLDSVAALRLVRGGREHQGIGDVIVDGGIFGADLLEATLAGVRKERRGRRDQAPRATAPSSTA